MPKQTLPDQHLLLHQTWPQDCCLCGHEAQIADLQTKLQQARAERDAAIENMGKAWCEYRRMRCKD